MSKQTVCDLIHFIDDDVTGIEQALRHIASTNDVNANGLISLGYPEHHRLVRTLRESAASWRVKADRLGALYEGLTDSDLEWTANCAREWVR